MLDTLKKYIENRFQLIKLELIGVTSNLAVRLISSFLLLVIGMLVLLMFSFSLSFWLSSLLDSYAMGFAAVGGIFILVFIIYKVFIKNSVDTKIKNEIVKAAFAVEEELTEKEI